MTWVPSAFSQVEVGGQIIFMRPTYHLGLLFGWKLVARYYIYIYISLSPYKLYTHKYALHNIWLGSNSIEPQIETLPMTPWRPRFQNDTCGTCADIAKDTTCSVKSRCSGCGGTWCPAAGPKCVAWRGEKPKPFMIADICWYFKHVIRTYIHMHCFLLLYFCTWYTRVYLYVYIYIHND